MDIGSPAAGPGTFALSIIFIFHFIYFFIFITIDIGSPVAGSRYFWSIARVSRRRSLLKASSWRNFVRELVCLVETALSQFNSSALCRTGDLYIYVSLSWYFFFCVF